ncbi:MAG: transporter [Bacteroidales bacterium]|nr:transporter [Bacteroidales bacterium]
MSIKLFVRTWMLPIAMVTGVLAYFVYARLHFLDFTHAAATRAVSIVQPTLIFCMLFLSFCKINPKRLRFRPWHWKLLLIQAIGFLLSALPLCLFPDTAARPLLEAAMICLLCPTATAAAVITGKLGGNTTNLVTYTLMANLMTALLAPLVFPLTNPGIGLNFVHSFLLILGKVCPLLMLPLIAAFLVRYFLPGLHKIIVKAKDLAFYIWSVSLTIALAVTTKILVHSPVSWGICLGIALVSLASCVFQFRTGKSIGGKHHDRISGGQSMGQKNTVFAIWLSYTFLTPVTAIAGGFYTIWHNVFNAYQLYRKEHPKEARA